MAVAHDFRGRRLALANAFREWRTANEAAGELGTETGSIFGLVKRMNAEGILEADSDPPTRGTQYRLTHEAKIALEQLDQALAAPDEVGRLFNDQRLLIVEGNSISEVEEILAEPANTAAIAWASWIGASWLIAMRPESDGHAWRKLATALERVGYRCERGRVDELLGARTLRRQSAASLALADTDR